MMKEQSQILIADDEKAIRTGLWHIIRRTYDTLDILLMENGLDAWNALCENRNIRMAFIDIRMLGMDGLQLCERMKREGLTTKVVIISGFRDFDYARQALRYGVSDYLLKPVNPTDILRLVKEVVSPLDEPDQQGQMSEEKQIRLVIERVRHWIHDSLSQDITLSDMAETLHYSPSYLSVLFKKEIGKGFQEYLTDCRMQRARHLLNDPALRMGEVAEHVGYTNAKSFAIAFRKAFHMTPTEYREQQSTGFTHSRTIS